MKPDVKQLARALRLLGSVLGRRRAMYCGRGRFAFRLDGGWRLVISADDAGRFRIDACQGVRVRATMWCLADDRKRLAELAESMQYEAADLVA